MECCKAVKNPETISLEDFSDRVCTGKKTTKKTILSNTLDEFSDVSARVPVEDLQTKVKDPKVTKDYFISHLYEIIFPSPASQAKALQGIGVFGSRTSGKAEASSTASDDGVLLSFSDDDWEKIPCPGP